jgi:hypothetical protein
MLRQPRRWEVVVFDRLEEGEIPHFEGAGAVLFVLILRCRTYLYADNRP